MEIINNALRPTRTRLRTALARPRVGTPPIYFFTRVCKILILWKLRKGYRIESGQNLDSKRVIRKIFRNKDLGMTAEFWRMKAELETDRWRLVRTDPLSAFCILSKGRPSQSRDLFWQGLWKKRRPFEAPPALSNPFVSAFVAPIRRKPRRMGQPLFGDLGVCLA